MVSCNPYNQLKPARQKCCCYCGHRDMQYTTCLFGNRRDRYKWHHK